MNSFTGILSNSPFQRRAVRRNEGRLKVLVYHETNHPENFERQLNWLTERFDVLSLDSLVEVLEGDRQMPPHPLVMTFDDARPSVYENGLPLARKYNVPAAVFVIAELIGTERPFWWDEVSFYAPDERVAQGLLRELKSLPDARRRERLNELREQHKGSPLKARQLNWGELREMEEAGWTVGNHTHSHPMLDRCPAGTIRDEMGRARELLAAKGLSGGSYLAFPNGNFDDRVLLEVEELGIKLAFAFDHRINTADIDPLQISRLSVRSDTSLEKLKLICSGLHSRLLPVRKFIARWAGL